MNVEVKIEASLNFPLTKEIEEKAQFVIDDFANKIRNEIIINIVIVQRLFQTGNLSNSIQIDRGVLKSKVEMLIQAYYGYFHEYGTKYLKPRPFFMPAVEKYKDDYLKAMREIV